MSEELKKEWEDNGAIREILMRNFDNGKSLIYSMILNKEVDDVEASKIVNKIRI